MEEDEIVPISTRGIKIPDNLENAIMKGLEVRAEDRWQSVEEFKAAIEGADVSYGSPVTANASPVITSTAAGERVSVWQTTGQQFSGQYEQPLQYTAGQPVTAEHQNMQVNPPQTPQEKSPDPIENKTITFWRKNKFAMIISAVACFLLVFSIIRTIGNNSGNGGSFVPVGNSEGNSNENDYVTNLQSDDTIEIPTPIAIEPIEIIAGEYYPESFESIFNEISNILSISLEVNIISPYNEFQSKIETSVSAGERSMFFGYYGDSDIENLRALGATVIQPNNYSYAYFIITPWIEEDIAVQIINEFEKITASIHVKDKEFSASSDSPAGKYSGDMLNGNRDGYGEMIYSNGGTYAGDWKDDLYNGHGILISPSGSQYEGEFVNGLPNGIGTLTSVEGDRYFENLIEGEYSNLGTETKADGTTGEAQSNSGESASSDNAAADKVNADKKAADKVAADKAKADKAAADLSALDEAMEAEKDKALKGRADKAAADKAAADKAAADKAAADKAAADKAAADKAAAEKAANAGEYSMTFSGKTYKYIASSGNPLTFSDNSYSAYFQREDEQGKYNSDNYIILYLPENVSTGNSYKSDLSYYNKLVELTLNGKFYHLDESFSKEYSKDSILSISGYYVNYSTVYISEWGGSGGTCKGTFEAQIELDTGDFIDFTGSFNCKIEGNGFN